MFICQYPNCKVALREARFQRIGAGISMRREPSMEAARGFGQLGVVALFPYE
jgi:hypothetical protein